MLSVNKGVWMVLTAAVLWGVSGTVAQFLFQQADIHVNDLVFIRLVLAGILLLILAHFTLNNGGSVWLVWSNRFTSIQLLIFGIVGMLAVQYTYFASIAEGDAATATLLQYLGPLFITIYVALRALKMPSTTELAAVCLALCGVALLVTNGSFDQLAISQAAVWWGLGSAVALAFYTLYPVQLLQQWSSALVVGWGMLIGGIGLGIIHPPWKVLHIEWNITLVGFVLFVVLFGTLLPFYLYLESLRHIKPTQTSILASAEPLAAAISAVIWLHVPFGFFQALGGLCIMGTVIIISRVKNKNKIHHEQKISQSAHG